MLNYFNLGMHTCILYTRLTSCSMYSLQYLPEVGNCVTSRSYSIRARIIAVVYSNEENFYNLIYIQVQKVDIKSTWCLVLVPFVCVSKYLCFPNEDTPRL